MKNSPIERLEAIVYFLRPLEAAYCSYSLLLLWISFWKGSFCIKDRIYQQKELDPYGKKEKEKDKIDQLQQHKRKS